MLKGLIGKKIGMTQIFDEQGVAYPVTIIEAGPCYVTQVRNQERDGYAAVQLGFGEVHPKKLAAGELGHLTASQLPPMRFLREFRSKEAATVGDKLTVEIFAVGERVDVLGVSKRPTVSPTVIEHRVRVLPEPHRDVSLRTRAEQATWAMNESPSRL